MTKKPRPTTEEILAIEGSVPVEVAARYLGQSKSFIYGGMQKGVLPIGTAYIAEKEWTYDIRPLALVRYNETGGRWQYDDFRKHVLEILQAAMASA